MKISVPFKLKIVVATLCAWVIMHLAYTTWDGMNSFTGNADVAIILGNTVFADSSLSPWLQARVDKALELYRQKKVKKIYASGGLGQWGVAEGDAMKKYLLEKGVPATDVVADNYGKNTYSTAKNFIEYNKSYQYTSAIMVSQFYHITRSKYIMRKLGFKNVKGASSTVYFGKDIIGLLREFVAFYKYLLVY